MRFSKKENFETYRKSIKKIMKPGRSKDNYVGIELEVLTKVPDSIITWELSKLEGVTADVGYDGSIMNTKNTPYTAEIRVLCKQSEVKDVIPKVITVLKELGAEVNKSCGLHVHLDMRNRKVAECFKKLVDKQRELFKKVAKNRFGNEHCRLVKTNDFKLATFGKLVPNPHYVHNPAYYIPNNSPQIYDPAPISRYHAINPRAYDEHKTLECRMHEGTLDSKKIIKWVDKLVSIVDEAS